MPPPGGINQLPPSGGNVTPPPTGGGLPPLFEGVYLSFFNEALEECIGNNLPIQRKAQNIVLKWCVTERDATTKILPSILRSDNFLSFNITDDKDKELRLMIKAVGEEMVSLIKEIPELLDEGKSSDDLKLIFAKLNLNSVGSTLTVSSDGKQATADPSHMGAKRRWVDLSDAEIASLWERAVGGADGPSEKKMREKAPVMDMRREIILPPDFKSEFPALERCLQLVAADCGVAVGIGVHNIAGIMSARDEAKRIVSLDEGNFERKSPVQAWAAGIVAYAHCRGDTTKLTSSDKLENSRTHFAKGVRWAHAAVWRLRMQSVDPKKVNRIWKGHYPFESSNPDAKPWFDAVNSSMPGVERWRDTLPKDFAKILYIFAKETPWKWCNPPCISFNALVDTFAPTVQRVVTPTKGRGKGKKGVVPTPEVRMVKMRPFNARAHPLLSTPEVSDFRGFGAALFNTAGQDEVLKEGFIKADELSIGNTTANAQRAFAVRSAYSRLIRDLIRARVQIIKPGATQAPNYRQVSPADVKKALSAKEPLVVFSKGCITLLEKTNLGKEALPRRLVEIAGG